MLYLMYQQKQKLISLLLILSTSKFNLICLYLFATQCRKKTHLESTYPRIVIYDIIFYGDIDAIPSKTKDDQEQQPRRFKSCRQKPKCEETFLAESSSETRL